MEESAWEIQLKLLWILRKNMKFNLAQVFTCALMFNT